MKHILDMKPWHFIPTSGPYTQRRYVYVLDGKLSEKEYSTPYAAMRALQQKIKTMEKNNDTGREQPSEDCKGSD